MGDQFDRVNGHLKRRGRALGIVQLELQLFRHILREVLGVHDLPFHELHAGVFLGIIWGSCDLHLGADLCGDIAALAQSGLCRAALNSNGTPQHGSGDAVNGGQLHIAFGHIKADFLGACFLLGAKLAIGQGKGGVSLFHLPVMELHALGGILIGGCVGLDGDRFALKGGSNLAGGVVAHLRGAVRNGNVVVSLPRLNAQVAASCRFCKRMNARVDQLCILGFAGIVDVFFAVCLCKVNSAHRATLCVVFQDHSTGSGDLGIFGDCSFGITDGNGDILGLVDRQVLRRSTVGTLNGHVTVAGDICAARHSAAVRRKDHFAGIINVQASVHGHESAAADIHLTGAVDRAGIVSGHNCSQFIAVDLHITCILHNQLCSHSNLIFTIQIYVFLRCIDFQRRALYWAIRLQRLGGRVVTQHTIF